MLKISFIIITTYLLYYLGNILYDLFLRKDKKVQTEELEEFSLGDFVESDVQLKQVGIEDVENVNTPESFFKNEALSQRNQDQDEKPEIDELRKKFEAEQEISVFNVSEIEEDLENTTNSNADTPKQIKPDWKELLKMSETTVHMVANYEGQKVYHSII